MPDKASISCHLDLYAYWLAKRGLRAMPGRSDLNPADIPRLLPHLIISERADDQFRHKLLGTGVVRDLGYDATGYFVGEYLNNPNFYAEAREGYQMACTLRDAVFATGEFCFELFGAGALHAWSALILPLSDDLIIVNKTIASYIARPHTNLAARPDWLERQPVKVLGVNHIADAAELSGLCLEWETGTLVN
jgi:PAS domain